MKLKSLKLIWQYLEPFKKKVYSLLIISLIAAAIAAVIPMIYGRLVDDTLNHQPFMWIGLGLLLWLILSLINHWLDRVVTRQSERLSVQSSTRMLIKFGRHFLNLPFSYLKEQKTGKILNSLDRSIMRFENIVYDTFFGFFPDVVTVILIIIIMANIHWLLSLILLLVLAGYVVTTIWQTKRVAKVDKKMHRAYRTTYGDFYEYLSNYETVKAFSAEEAARKSIRHRANGIISVVWESALAWNNLKIWQSSIFTIGFVGLFGLGIWLLGLGHITAGNLVTFVGYISFIFGVLSRLARTYTSLNRALSEIEESHKLFKVKTEDELRNKNIEKIENISGQIVFDNVSFQYPGKNQPAVLRDVSFKIKPGEVIALVGESGAGKSTLVDLVSSYYLPQFGNVIIDSYDTSKISGQNLRQHIAIVPQEVSLFHETINFNISYGQTKSSQAEIEATAKAANAHKFIMKLPKGYRSKVGERGVKLSVGQKQRIAIARALLRDPKILILDEATSSLDSITENLVQEALKHLVRGRTTFIIAHRLSTITHADRIFVLDKGNIVEIGKHEQLLAKNGIYKKLYEAQRF